MHAPNMMLLAKRWIEATHSHAWQRRGGSDHIWLSPNDEGKSAGTDCYRMANKPEVGTPLDF